MVIHVPYVPKDFEYPIVQVDKYGEHQVIALAHTDVSASNIVKALNEEFDGHYYFEDPNDNA